VLSHGTMFAGSHPERVQCSCGRGDVNPRFSHNEGSDPVDRAIFLLVLLLWPTIGAAQSATNVTPPTTGPTTVVTPDDVETLAERCPLCGEGNLPELLVQLAHSDPQRRIAAIHALAKSVSPLALAPLERVALADRTPAVRVAAVRAIAARGDLRAVDTLVTNSEDRFVSVRIAALTALGDFSLGPIRSLLARRLMDGDRSVPERAAALAALQRHGTRQAHAEITALASSVTEANFMAEAIREAAARPQPCPTCLEPDRTQLINELFAKDSELRQLAAEQLSDLPVPLADRLSLYQVAMADEEKAVRRAAVAQLVEDAIEHESALPLLAVAATHSGDADVRRPAMRALANDPRPAASTALGHTVRDGRVAVASRAVALLKLRPDAESTRVLADTVAHPKEKVALRAIGALYDREPPADEKRRALDTALAHESRAVVAAGLLGVTEATAGVHNDGLIRASKREDLSDETLARVTRMLASSPTPAALDALVELAAHESGPVRAAAITHLGKRPEPEAGAALSQLTKADNEATARLARRTMVERGTQLPAADLLALLEEDPQAALAVVGRQKNGTTLESLLPVLAAALAHADVAVSKAALKELLRKPQPGRAVLIAHIVAAIESSPNPDTLNLLYRYLVHWDPPILDAQQRRLAANESLPAGLRTHALAAVAAREPADLVLLLTPLTDDREPGVRNTARRLLAAAPAASDIAAGDVGRVEETTGTLAAAEDAEPTDTEPEDETEAEGPALGAVAPENQEIPELEKPDVPWDGRWPLILSMAALSSVAFGTIADIAELEAGPTAAIYGVGGVLGGATPFLLTMNRDVTMGQAMYVTSHTAWAAALGWRGAHLLDLNDTTGRPGLERGLGILGGLGGIALGSWRASKANWTGRDAAFANLTAVQAALAAKSIGMLADSENPNHNGARLNSLAVVTGWGLGLMPATLFNEHLKFSDEDYWFLATAMGIGTFTGAWAGLSADDGVVTGTAQKVGVGAIAGQSLGYLAGVALAPALELSPRTSGRLAIQAGIGATFGLGLAMTMPPPEEPDLGKLGLVVNLGTLAGVVTAVTMPHVLDFAPGKRGMLALSAGYGAAAGTFLPWLDANYQGEATRHLGGALLGATAGVMIGSAVAPLVDPSGDGLGVASGTTALFATTGLGVGLFSCNWSEDCPSRRRLTAATQLGAAAGVLTAALLGDRIPASASGASNLAAGMAWGAWNGYLLTRLDLDAPGSALAGGSLLLGTAAGATIYLATDRLSLPPWVGWAGLGGWLAGNTWGATLAYAIPETSEHSRLALTLTGPLALGAIAGVLLPAYDTPPPVRARSLALGAVLGAWHTGMLAFTWDADTRQGTRAANGAAFGALTGAGMAYALSNVLDADDFTEMAIIAAGANLAGVGLGRLRGEDTALSMQLLGVGAMVLGGVAAPFTEYQPRDGGWLLANGALIGGWNGMLIGGRMVHTDGVGFVRGSGMTGGLLLGATSGALAVAAASQWAPTPEIGDIGEVVLASGLGNIFGLGLALSVDDPELWPYMAGGGLGLAVLANIWAPHTEFNMDRSLWVVTGAALGAWHGALWQGHPNRSDDTSRTVGGAGIGLALGALGTGVLSQLTDRDPADVAEIGLAAGAGNVLALGISNLALAAGSELDADLLRGRLSLGLGAGLAAAATVWAPHTEYDRDAWLWSAALSGAGAWHGALFGGVPGAWHDNRVASGGALTGAALGALAAGTMSQWYRPTPYDTGEAMTGMAAGNLLGLGLGLSLKPGDSRLQGHLMQGLGLGGLITGAVLAPRTSYRPPDYGLAAAFTGLGAWHGLLWTGAPGSDDFGARRAAGGALVGGSVGLLSAAVLSQHSEVHGTDIGELLLAATLGNTLALGISDLYLGWGGETSAGALRGRASLVTGLGLTALATGLAPYTEYSSHDLMWAGSLGLAGAWNGALTAGFTDGQLSRGGALVGGSVGLLTGAVLSQWIDREPTDIGEALVYSALGNTTGLGLGLLLANDAGARATVMQGLGLGGLVAGTVLAPYTDFDRADAPLFTLAAGTGAAAGIFLPGVWSGDDTERGGAAMLGASLGLLTAAGLSQRFELHWSEALEAGVAYAGGSAFGFGLGGLIDVDSCSAPRPSPPVPPSTSASTPDTPVPISDSAPSASPSACGTPSSVANGPAPSSTCPPTSTPSPRAYTTAPSWPAASASSAP